MYRLPGIRAIVIAALLIMLGAIQQSAAAHPGFSATALIKIDEGGHFSLILRHDALAFALDETPANIADSPMFELLAANEKTQAEAFTAGKERFQSLFVLEADSKRVDVTLTESPSVSGLKDWKQSHPERRLPVKLDFAATAALPSNARIMTFHFPQVLGDVLVTVERPDQEPVGFPLRSGEESPTFVLNEKPASSASEKAVNRSTSPLTVAMRYIVLGFSHIIPYGADHALFVLGLFLLSPRAKALLWQISAFTIAHTITLTLTTLHLVKLPAVVIEPTIAASIAFIAVENIFAKKVHPWRPAVAFVFGLIHGMGFASALSEVGLPTGQLAAGLAGFSVGVECGHLVVLGAAFLILGWWREETWYRSRLVIPISIAISAIALFWMIQRICSLW